jgi:Protein of unknown function (DUF2726)
MPSWGLAALAAVVVLLLIVVVLRRRAPADGKGADGARLDTVAAWPPTATRILTTAERNAYSILVRALPGYMILAQVPLARFLKVPTRHSYSEWLRRLGTQCADLVVCDMASEVLAVVNVQAPAGSESERARKRLNRMARVLKAAGIPMHVWTDNALPSAETAREMLLPKAASAPVAAAAPSPVADTRVRASRPTPFDESQRDSTQDELIEVREPPPSTWFDEFNTGPAPLPGEQRKR